MTQTNLKARQAQLIILKGRPITKKNSQQIYRTKGRPHIAQSDAFQNYETDCLWQLKGYRGQRFEPGARLNLSARYWMPNRSGWPDLIGVLQATCDILEKAGVIFNDRDITTFDGSRIVGVDKQNPRVEIEIIEEVSR